jgi:hypothetical protein
VGLTSPALPYLLIAVSAVLLVVIMVTWSRLARFRVWTIALRIISLCLLQASVLALIFVIVNNSGEFYSSWSDLLGSDNAGARLIAATHGHVPAKDSHRPLIVTGHWDVTVRGHGKAGGVLDSVRIYGQLSGITAVGHVYLPAGYKPSDKRRYYPVIVEISDLTGSLKSPYGAEKLAQSAALQIAAHQLEPVIVVMLPAKLAADDQACLNIPPSFRRHRKAPPTQGETFYAQDLPNVLESAYQVSSQPGNWALLGDNSGGYCALQLALDNSNVFSVAVAPDGSYTGPPDAGAAQGSALLRRQNDLIWQLRHLPMQPVSVLLTGPNAKTGAGKAEPIAALAQRPMRVTVARLSSGTWPLAGVLDWIGAEVSPQAQHD